MSHYSKPVCRPMLAGEALEKYRLVIIGSSDDTVIYPTGAKDTQIVGITQSAASAGETVDVAYAGFSLLAVNGNSSNIAVGDSICVGTSAGIGVKATGGSAANVECAGFADEASTADGDVISIQVQKHLKWFAS